MRNSAILFLIIPSLLLAACTTSTQRVPAQPTQPDAAPAATPEAPAATAAAPEARAIPVDALRNATYSGIYDQPITLAAGKYEGEPFVAGDPARPTVEFIDGAELTGDLDGDGVDDAVVFLLERGGGSGAFTHVAAQLNRDGQPVDAGAVRIEDRIGVRSAAIEDGQVVLDIITQGPGDVACCGTHKAHKTYALQDGRLIETTAAGGDLVKVSLADLDGTSWTLLTMDGQPAPADSAVTLSFQAGQVTGSGGCNSYGASFDLGEDNPFVMTIGPLTAAEKSCPEPAGSQESAYLAALGSVAHWGYDFGRLALYYAGGQDVESRLIFAPQGAPGATATTDQPLELAPPPGESSLIATGYALEQAAKARKAPDLEATMKQIEAIGAEAAAPGQQEAGATKPQYVADLESAYGPPSQAGFGSAVFYEPLGAEDSLTDAALAKYKHYVGELWERWGEYAWMGPWKEVYARAAGATPDIVAELRGITDRDAAISAPMILDAVQDAKNARVALAAAFDDPAVTELRVFNLGDGGAMSGILVAGRRADTADATFLVFLLD